MKSVAVFLWCIVGLIGVGARSAARAETVDALVVLAADVSRSIDAGEFDLQRKGYAAALTDARVLRAIAGSPHHAVGLTFVEWAGPNEQKTVADWTVVRDGEGGAGIAATLLAAPRSFVGRTAIGSAIDFAMSRLAMAPNAATKRIIDVSGDGTSNSGRSVEEARDAAVAAGVTINGLAIINNNINPGYAFHTHPPGGLPKYYQENVIGGSGAFLMRVENFTTFADAIARKLVAEIAHIKARHPATYVQAGR